LLTAPYSSKVRAVVAGATPCGRFYLYGAPLRLKPSRFLWLLWHLLGAGTRWFCWGHALTGAVSGTALRSG
jgi:hypothetical protein